MSDTNPAFTATILKLRNKLNRQLAAAEQTRYEISIFEQMQKDGLGQREAKPSK